MILSNTADATAEAVNSDFLFLSGIHRLHDNEKPIGVAPVVLRGSSFLFPDDALG
jgi:hypothetical protein